MTAANPTPVGSQNPSPQKSIVSSNKPYHTSNSMQQNTSFDQQSRSQVSFHSTPHQSPMKPQNSAASANSSRLSRMSESFKRSQTVVKVKEFAAKKKGERMYKFVETDLLNFLRIVGSMCAVFHFLGAFSREVQARSICSELNPLQKFLDGFLRLAFSVFLCHLIIAKPVAQYPLQHAAAYFWMMLNLIALYQSLQADDVLKQALGQEISAASSVSQAACMLIAILCLFCSIIVSVRELKHYCMNPKLYQAFQKHSSWVGDGGRIIFLKKLNTALIEAGAVRTIKGKQVNVFDNDMLVRLLVQEEVIESEDDVRDEVYVTFAQFEAIHESVMALIDVQSQGNAVGNTSFASKPSLAAISESGVPKSTSLVVERGNSGMEEVVPSGDNRV